MAASRKAPPPRPWRRRLVWALRIGIGLLLLGLIAIVAAVYIQRGSIPSFDQLKSSPNGQMIRVHAADGTVIVSLGPSYGDWLPYERIPQVMRDAMVATEDRRFYSHIGIDPIGVARATKLAIFDRDSQRRLQGASTITQQVARTIFLSNRRTYRRKMREALLALALERKFSKDQILELYLNKVYFGGGAYGIDAASRKFFGHPADQLSLAEAAVIAGLVKAPSHYSPSADVDAARDRAKVVLGLMVETGKISRTQADAANLGSIAFTPEPKQNSVRYFTDWALPQLNMLIDEQVRPLEVYTTLDLSMQRQADTAVRANVPKGAQGALVSIDRDGAVRAMVGGTDYVTTNYNRAVTAERQPGSAFKLFVYLAALEAGHRPDEMMTDQPVTIQGWSPRNDSRHFSGAISMRNAFAYSINTVAAQLGQEVGFSTVADMARRFGITTDVNTHPSMVLGSSDVKLIDMTRAFASVGNKGVMVTPFGITKVTAGGETIYSHEVDRSHVLVAPYVAAEMTDLLQTAVNTGTGRAAQIGRPVAGKTGTTSSSKDGWFLGFSSGLTTGVWMGRDDARPIAGLHGGTAPARAFHDFMGKAVASRAVETFDTAVTMPDLGLDDESNYFGEPDNSTYFDEDGNPVATRDDGTTPPSTVTTSPAPDGQMVDADGNPLPQPRDTPPDDHLDQDWIDRVTGRTTPRPTPTPRERRMVVPMTPPGRSGGDYSEDRPNQ